AEDAPGLRIAGIEGQRASDLAARVVDAVLLEQDAARVDVALYVLAIERDRGSKSGIGTVELAALPRRQPEHVEAPGVPGTPLRVGVEHVGRRGVLPRAERRVGGRVRYVRRNRVGARRFGRGRDRSRSGAGRRLLLDGNVLL